jgi:hypothetical protein
MSKNKENVSISEIESFTGKLNKNEKKRVEDLIKKNMDKGKILNEIQMDRDKSKSAPNQKPGKNQKK